MNLKNAKKFRKFVKSSAADLPVSSYVVGRSNTVTYIDEKGELHQQIYTGTIRVDVRTQRGQYKLMKKIWKQDMRGL